MNNATAILDKFGTYEWNARVYGVLAFASRVAASVKNRTNAIKVIYHLRSLSRLLKEFLDTVHNGMEGKLPADPKAEPITPARLRDASDQLENLYRTLDYIYEGCRRAGLTNNSLAAGTLSELHKQSEEFAMLADWCDVTSEPDAVDDIFNRAKREKERGELIDLAKVQ